MIDNIVIGELVDGLTLADLGILDHEVNVHISMDEAEESKMFLPSMFVKAGLFKSTSEIKKIAKQRDTSKKIKDDDSRLLWRTLTKPELTQFKIGKKAFWVVVGTIDK